MAGLLYRLGRFAARRRWTVIISWLVILCIVGVTYALFHGSISSTVTIPGTATSKVQDQLANKFPKASGGSGTIVFTTKDGSKFTSAEKSDIDALLKRIDHVKGVKGTTSGFASQKTLDDKRQQITDGRTQIADARKKIASAQAELNSKKTALEQSQSKLDSEKAAAAGNATALAQLSAAQTQITDGQAQITAAQKQIDQNTAKLDAQEKKLTQGAKLLALSKNIRTVSKDGNTAIGTVQFHASTYDIPQSTKTTITDKAEHAGIEGVHVYVASDISSSVPQVVGPGEIVGIVIAAIVLFIMLGTLIGAGLPLLSAIVGVGVGTLASLSFSGIVDFMSATSTLGLMLGLAVGIDYSLFILNRHRRQLKEGMGVHESIGLATGTSGNAVVFAGSTVVVALLALNVTGIPFLGLMGTVGAVAVAVAICVAITFTPAMLALSGMRLLRRKEQRSIGDTASTRVPNAPMSTWRAIITLVIGVAALGTIALPAAHMRLGLPDGSSEATSSSQYKAFKTLAKDFGAGQNGPLVVMVTLPDAVAKDAITAREITVGQSIKKNDDVSAVLPIGASNDRTIIAFEVIPKGGPSSVSTEQLVRDLRDMTVSVPGGKATLGVAGNASATIDVSQKLSDALPLYLVVVVGLSLLILIVVFRSILVPVTATAGFVLSLMAAFGGLTAIYQFGWLGSVFGVHDPGPILSFLPIIEVGVLFGLAMDYQLFLVSGMREAYAHGSSARVAVQRGFHAGRSVVAAAAIIMISVFSGFIFSDSSLIRPIGFGLAFGVLLDAFVVRMLLIPAAMHLLGRAAWWLPKWLAHIIPDVDVEGAKLERSHPVSAQHGSTGTHALPYDATAEQAALRDAEGHTPTHRA